MGVYIQFNDYSAMQGPAPDGFHVPLLEDWVGLKTIMDGLNLTTGADWKVNLHLPFAGQRTLTSSIMSQGTDGYYRTCVSSSSSSNTQVPGWYINLSSASSGMQESRMQGFSIRPFKNYYVKPTSTWDIINGTLGSAGIFWNHAEGIISITDGTIGYTIQDKNLGATTVYNDGDTLSEANCGYYYQWGNNYGFAWTGNITTSTTRVDASSYGPGNYYSSNVYIRRSSGSYDWSSVRNDNLRGGVTGVNPMSDLKNAYIGEYQENWQPGPNTIAYYKFDGNLNDDSGNSHDMSLYTGSVTYGTASGGGKYAHFNQNTWTNYWTYSGFNYDGEYTISFRFNPQTIFSSGGPHDIVELRENSTYAYLRIANSIYITYGLSPDYSTPLSSNTWYNIIYTRSGGSAELFINGELVKSGTPSYSGRTNQTVRFRVNQVPDTNSSSCANNGYYSEVIWENKARTTQEKLNYYNNTKNLYGIS